MIYTIQHRTTYSYERPVGFGRCVLRLVPATSSRQMLLDSEVRITPDVASDIVGIGAFGESTRIVIIDQPHDELVIEARSRVDVRAENAVPVDACPWEAVSVAAFGSNSLVPDSPANFLYPTRRTPTSAAITDYARASFGRDRSIADAATDLMTRIHADFTYDAEATTVSTPALTAFTARQGVCQDFAHIMIVALHGLGLPAAYVSGYLRTRPPPGQARLAGADATHAWVAVWCGATSGWIGFDPTNATLALNNHIVLAVGRDYSDVAPVDGIILSPGKQTIKVEVDVVPADELVTA